jgi:dCMP deaminase
LKSEFDVSTVRYYMPLKDIAEERNDNLMTHEKPSWDNYFLEMAEVIAKRSPDKKRQVGCVIVDEHRRVVATGYNGTPASFDDSKVDWWDRTIKDRIVIHAEANALIYADGPKLRGGTLYCSYSPCINCAKLIAAAGINRVVYREQFDDAGLEMLSEFRVDTNCVSS